MKFIYTNYKNETEERDIDVLSFDFLSKPGFGYQPGWFITGIDREKKATRSFRIDERMRPLQGDLHLIGGTGGACYPITEGHEVRSAVDKIADVVQNQLDAANPLKKDESGVGAYIDGATVDR